MRWGKVGTGERKRRDRVEYVGERKNRWNMYRIDSVQKGGRGIGERIREILDEEGRSEEWITEIERVKRERRTGNGEEGAGVRRGTKMGVRMEWMRVKRKSKGKGKETVYKSRASSTKYEDKEIRKVKQASDACVA